MKERDEPTDYQIAMAALNQIRWRCTGLEEAREIAHQAVSEIHDRALRRLKWMEGKE